MNIDPARSIVITGGGGFLGARVAQLLLERIPEARVVLTDITRTSRVSALGSRVEFVEVDISSPDAAASVIDASIGVIFHLASLVSGGAERDFEAGLRANVYATIHVLEACRLHAESPTVVFTSSIATFGGKTLPAEVTDETHQHPQNSYGAAKVVGEQLLNDYSRKGYLSGRGVRLPAVVVRDVANSAASGYASTMVREALAGHDYACPVGRDTRIPIIGADTAVRLLVALAELDDGALGDYRTINGPGISPTAGEIAETVARLSESSRPVGTISFSPNPEVEAIVASWPREMPSRRSDELGLPRDEGIEPIVASYVSSIGNPGSDRDECSTRVDTQIREDGGDVARR